MFTKIYHFLLRLETGVLVSLLLSMIVMAVVQIVMRNIFSSGIIWADSFVRITVLWLALIGAMVATRSGKHIYIDVIFRFLSEKSQSIVRRFTDAFASMICAAMGYYSYEFVKMEFEDGGMAFASVPNWLCESIIPVAFIIIAIRYFVSAILNIRHSS